MEYYAIRKDTLTGLGEAIRSVIGTSDTFTPNQMIEEVTDIMNAATFILVDKDGNEYPAIYVDSDVVFTATENDIRKGYTAVTAEGVTVGTKEIPAYYVEEGFRVITPGSQFSILTSECDYKKLQAIVCPFDSSLANSVCSEKVVMNDSVYPVASTEVVSTVTKDPSGTRLNLNFNNDAEKPYLIRYFMFREVY